MSAVLVLTTIALNDDPRPLARLLVEKRLAACVNILPAITSIYRWEGAISEDGEQLLVIKTSEERVDALRDALLEHHPYEVPEFMVVSVESMSEGYGAWLLSSVAM